MPSALVVEDNSHDARLIEIMLASARSVEFEVHVVHRLALAQDWLSRRDADVILLDLSLPDSRGLATFETLHALRADIPIVVLSGLQDEDVALSAVQSGAQDYLVKSQESDDAMVRAVQYAIERFRGSRALRQREAHLRLLTEQLPCLYWTTDLNLRLTSFSGATLFGDALPSGGVEGCLWKDLLGEDLSGRTFVELHQRAVKGASASMDLSRHDQVYHVHIEPFRHRNGATIGTVGVALDVTSQKLVDFELRLTRKIQDGLRPRTAPHVDGFDIAGFSKSAAEAGGDYFDYFPMRDGSTGVVVCDVAGHGLGPAMMMCHTRAYVRALAVHYDDPVQILEEANRFLHDDTSEERLVALFLAKLSRETRTVHYANAGHRGFLFHKGAAAKLLRPTGIPLNVDSDYASEPASPFQMHLGDLLLLYTDGLIDCVSADGEAFGQTRMLNLIAAAHDKSPQQIVQRLFDEVQHFTPLDAAADDMTAVIIKAA